jgi:hypothetical protein
MTNIKAAYELGKKAFHGGAKRIPALDAELKSLLRGPMGSGIPTLNAWLKGWDNANLGIAQRETVEVL